MCLLRCLEFANKIFDICCFRALASTSLQLRDTDSSFDFIIFGVLIGKETDSSFVFIMEVVGARFLSSVVAMQWLVECISDQMKCPRNFGCRARRVCIQTLLYNVP